MNAIVVKNLEKTYKVYQKNEGVFASIKGLWRRDYKTVHAVSDVSFSIEQGEIVAFLGPNGAGKTTTLKLLSGLIFPSAGEATVLGHIPWKRENEYRRRFSLVMGQKNQLWWDLPAQESFRLHKEIYRIDPQQYERRIDELTSLLEVRHLIGQPVRELSLGERMRMELIAALLHKPDVLLLDEPTIGLDVVSQRRVQEFLKYYQIEQKTTVVLTSHYMKDVEALCKRAVIINQGQIKHDGPLSDILDRFSNYKIMDVQFDGDDMPRDFSQWGEVIENEAPRVKLKVPRNKIPEILSNLLSKYRILDVGVQERPLEEVIAEVFTEQKNDARRLQDEQSLLQSASD
ncbi:ABC transporter ATP-binding protein [Gimesia maris]|uniref:ABC transporter ATP-binding protein YbhF n=1 Tax=Gimesia maris TaxID=122 RepID=A0ABX5YIK1_9PLAN|nr:ABC transporter ATP-binding protein [Gimesia maris]EDL56399.1 ABC transporter, ATP-binding protein [Gimesia maris DSM 8797]QDT77845.1 putative ABC transporter ATP-binding protein YbhF [Gimesia maris]QDU13507.1 putative ABC transporter ATP-binding protein YbhF [Gimesia maris]QEG15435.1 putative ABC transporter ATP-binding protein YbhF [Gimesia maris]QGQ31251.1 ATP-binding cassette domain-containing protein [Gimesia maris]|tara:strand:+ start:1330 stop:2361 length:1032 start_codon:yes stop_codon:yes gene_type:complete